MKNQLHREESFKLIINQVVQELPCFYVTRKIIIWPHTFI